MSAQRKTWKRMACIVALAVLAAACGSSGKRFPVDSIPAIQRGRWTQKEVKARFGEPQGITVRDSGRSTWRYRYEENSSQDTGSVFRIGAFIASILGQRVITPPVGVRNTDATVYSLDVEFNREGVVQDYTYSRDTRPTKQVY
jgi:hypothetical protein